MTPQDQRKQPLPLATDPLPQLADETLATLSHELRTPLAAIKGFTTTLLRHDTHLSSVERQEFLQEIDVASDRMGRVIDQLMRLTELARMQDIQRLPVVLDVVAQQVCDAASQRWRGSHTLRLHLPSEPCVPVPWRINADAQLLGEVIMHLLDNAAHYSPPGSEISLELHYHPNDPAPTVALQVSDQGIGILPEHLTHIFEPFYRVDQGLTREVDGLGLGLASCARIVELHHGMIAAHSTFGNGTTMTVTLPLLLES